MSEPESILQVEEVCVDFETRRGMVRVLNRISLELKQGEAIGIVGESGCGKSMTALAIMRLITEPGRISEGKILLRGQNLLGLNEREMRDIRGNKISMIFQEPMTALNPVFTIGKQIREGIELHQGASKEESVHKAIDMLQAVGIPAAEQRIRQYPHELSGGMRQRAMIAMALCCQPMVLLADEPSTALDVTVQAQIFDLLVDIQKKMGTAVILITHDMGVIAEFAQRVVVMYAGRKVEEGPVERIIKNPQHPYTKGLIQCVPHLHADPGLERVELKEIPGVVPDMSRLGPGCPFQPRCQYSIDPCREKMPPETTVGEHHRVACWLAGISV
jgi:oligopeptide/dipeptide ABC transporter ATP-binding protein